MIYKELADMVQRDYVSPIMAARVGNQMHELADEYRNEENVEFLDLTTEEGMNVYRKSLTYLFVAALRKVFPGTSARVEFALKHSLYLSVDRKLSTSELFRVEAEMRDMIRRDIPFVKQKEALSEALRYFREEGFYEKVAVFRYRRSSTVSLYELDGFREYFYSDLAYSTGSLSLFSLKLYEEGILLLFPKTSAPGTVSPIPNSKKLYRTLLDSTAWAQKMGVSSAGELNDAIVEKRVPDLVLMQEAKMEAQITAIVEDIIRKKSKIVLIAGPSSSGKTSFSNRLSIQLRTQGLRAYPIACDDYFVNRDQVPFDENGKQDFENIDIVDLPQLEADMAKLKAGEEVPLPHYNFITGKREYNGQKLRLQENDIVVMEGIHCLNPRFLPDENPYRIYISALPVLNLDGHNYISSSDSRLLRRIARDAVHRDATAQKTISMWKSVRDGEERNIFPYQENADAMFNSALLYELPIIKYCAEPLLFAVDRDSEEWATAKRLLKFLDFFLGYAGSEVPNNSLLREFMGGSCFDVG